MPAESTQKTQTKTRLWDEITKAIIYTMTPRLLPVIKEAYGKEYPPGTSLTLYPRKASGFLRSLRLTTFSAPAG